jgi:hypothetical protein
MSRKIKVIICKEDSYDVQTLIDEVKDDPKSAFDFCKLHGDESFPYKSFDNFDSLTQKAKDRLIIDLAISKSAADVNFSEDQNDQFEIFPEFFEDED